MKNEMLFVHCVVYRENLSSKILSPVLNKVLRLVIKCINVIKVNAECERLFKLFYLIKEKARVFELKIFFHTKVRWILKGNFLKRFMELYKIIF